MLRTVLSDTLSLITLIEPRKVGAIITHIIVKKLRHKKIPLFAKVTWPVRGESEFYPR